MYRGKGGDCIGGLVGAFYTNLGIQNSYNAGIIDSSNNIGNPEIGNIIGRTRSEYSNNIYYLKNNNLNGIYNKEDLSNMALTELFMKSDDFVDWLNQSRPNTWKKDISNINGRISNFILAIMITGGRDFSTFLFFLYLLYLELPVILILYFSRFFCLF